MKIEPGLQTHIEAAFAPLNNRAAANAFPPSSTLSNSLKALVPARVRAITTRNVSADVATMFTIAAVNVWLRAVHSFLISASLTDVSPVWASVSGYYSSHYSVRAMAHLLGFFQLFTARLLVQVELQGGRHVCTFSPKTAGDREHRVYWKLVKKAPQFATDLFFTENNPSLEGCDMTHRDHANYADFLPAPTQFRPLDATALKNRIERIAEIEIHSPPIPQVDNYPEIKNVQIVAYHRLVRFRQLVDGVLGGANRFWNVHRNPPWTRDFLHFQVTEKRNISE